jgi:pSer/pThr/pTyr-binding forkhead associated (FHA) protein
MRIQEAERARVPFLLYRDGDEVQQVLTLTAETERVSIGRREGCDLAVAWDERVSRTHAIIERVGDEWAVTDDGLSRNGTFLNGERISGRRRLSDRDVLRVGRTPLLFRMPGSEEGRRTAVGSRTLEAGDITSAQRRVLQALAQPTLAARGSAPATNDRIAAELHLSLEAVKGHLRSLFRRFGIEDLPQVQKRIRLVQLAIDAGLVSRDRPT